MTRAPLLLAFCALVLALAAAPLRADADLAFATLVRAHPYLQEMARIAARHDVPFGIYGGTLRDLYLDRPFTVISDYDIMFDSSRPGFPAFRDAVLELQQRSGGRMPAVDFHFDVSRRVELSERQEALHHEGITITKVGVFTDGRVIDTTGHGVEDLRAHRFRFFAPHPRERLKLENLGRFVRDLVRFADLERDPATIALLRRSIRHHRDARTADGARARSAARRLRALAGAGLVDFPLLIGPNRRDIQRLHDGEIARLSDLYPVDVFLFELFKSVTQAPKVEWLREVLRTLEVDRLLADVGLAREAELLLDTRRDRDALFTAFQFPGRRRASRGDAGLLALWEDTLRRYTYRVLFDMLASEWPAGSPEQRFLEAHRDQFVADRTWQTLSPGDRFAEEVLGFLDRDFNIGRLPRERVTRSLAWFVRNYLPHGERTLVPVPAPAVPAARRAGLTRGWSPEVRAIAPSAAHSMRDLPEYLARQLGRELVPLYRDPRTSLAFLATDRAGAAADLRAAGFADVYEVNACGASRRRGTMLAYDRAGPRSRFRLGDRRGTRVCLAEYGFSSVEQLLNHQARARLLGGITEDRVLVRRETDPDDFPGRERLLRFARGFHEPVEVLFVGFTNPLKRLLTSWHPLEIAELKLATGLLPGPRPRRAFALSAFGANHGSLPARVVRALRGAGLRQVVFLGTGGGLSLRVPRFAWAVPDRVALPSHGGDSVEVPIANRAAALRVPPLSAAIGKPSRVPPLSAAIGKPSRVPGAIGGVRHVTVFSPLMETAAWVDRERARGTDTVDCELAHVAAEPVELWALINVTDFPRGTADRAPVDAAAAISLENSPVQRAAVESALARIVGALAAPAPGAAPRRSRRTLPWR